MKTGKKGNSITASDELLAEASLTSQPAEPVRMMCAALHLADYNVMPGPLLLMVVGELGGDMPPLFIDDEESGGANVLITGSMADQTRES